VDRNYDVARLEANRCILQDDYRRLGIYPNESGDKGFQANFHSEQELFELLAKFYGCDILGERERQTGDTYFISMNNRKGDGTVRTILAALDLAREDSINMPGKMALYPSLDFLKATEGYAKVVESYGAENVFFQGFNLGTLEFVGLFDSEGTLVVGAEGQLVK
jgi:hypothetical protein